MFNPQIHYRSSFDIKQSALSNYPSTFQIVVEHVGRWLSSRTNSALAKSNIFKRWLFIGGEWTSGMNIRAQVMVDGVEEEKKISKIWVFRYEHPDRDNSSRIWRTDISLISDNCSDARISVTVTYYLRKDYLGAEPIVPDLSIPKIVQAILDDENIHCSIGTDRIVSTAEKMVAADGRRVQQLIVNPGRVLPIILMNINALDKVITPNGLQKLILGSGKVFWYDDHSIHSALNYEWGSFKDSFSCGQDSIRVYLPNFNKDRFTESRRHRFFPLQEYIHKPKELLKILCQSMFRINSLNITHDHITSLESFSNYLQKKKLKALREAAINIPRSTIEQEYVTALEEDNDAMNASNRLLNERVNNLENENLAFQIKIEELENRESDIQKQFGEFGKLRAHYVEVEEKLANMRLQWKTLPTNLYEALLLLQDLCPDRIIILDEALQSAKDANFQYVNESWSLLLAMANELYEILFGEEAGNIEDDFKNLTGFSLTLKESSSTKADNKLMQKRKRVYEGNEIDISAHTKLEKQNKDLRIHFHADQKKRLLVIGHCGDHLPTAGTQRRKEG